jgi:hypothetical protein
MVTTNDVNTITVDRILRVAAVTMAAAHNYERDWSKKAVVMINAIARELKPFLKVFARPLNEQLSIQSPELGKGIVMRTSSVDKPDGPDDWSYLYDDSKPNQVPRYIVCFGDRGWTLVRKPDMQVIEATPEMVAGITGESDGRYGEGGMSLFLSAWEYTIAELIRERRQRLDDLEQGCLLGLMEKAFQKSKWADMQKFTRSLNSDLA